MLLETFKNFTDFELLDSGNGYRLERWGGYILARPDPQAIWERHLPETEWQKVDALFQGKWHIKRSIKQPWTINFPLPLAPGEAKTGDWDIKLLARLTPFKHTGIFAEQAANWNWMINKISNISARGGSPSGGKYQIPKKDTSPKILNLFAYTGAASVILAKLGCFVTHVDASKPSIGLAKENLAVNKLPNDSIRWILDDAVKFVKREVKRGIKYDGIIMDPPAFGHSPTGKTWKFAEDFPGLLKDCVQLLSPQAKFLLINAYATNSSAIALENVLGDAIKNKAGTIAAGELCLQQADNRLLSTGIFARWSS